MDENSRFSQGSLGTTPDPATRPRPFSPQSTAKCEHGLSLQIRSLMPQKNTRFLPYTLSKLSLLAPRCNATVPAEVLPTLLIPDGSELHALCVQALASAYFGRTNRDERACSQGLQLYSQALTQLRSEINMVHNRGIVPETIMSVLCLCVFENVVFSQQTAWLMHYEGAGIVVSWLCCPLPVPLS